MTKKEQTQFADLTAERDLYRAMYVSPLVAPDLSIPAFPARTKGWLFNSYREGSVIKASSGSVYHYYGEYAWEKEPGCGSQNGRAIYSTKLMALQALRGEVSLNYAKRLAEIDALIAAEEVPT